MGLAQDLRFARVLRDYGRKVHTYARNSYYVAPGFSVEDMEQELLMVLAKAVETYQSDKGATFNTYFQVLAKRRIATLKKRYSTKSRTAEVVYITPDDLRELPKTTDSAEVQALARLDIHNYITVVPEEQWSENLECIPWQRRRTKAAALAQIELSLSQGDADDGSHEVRAVHLADSRP